MSQDAAVAASSVHIWGSGMGASFGLGRPAVKERKHHGQGHRHRPRHHQFLRRGDGRQDAPRDRERGGHAHHTLDRRVHRRRRTARRPAGQAPGGHQSGEDHLCGQAPDRPPLRRPDGREGQEARPLQDRQGLERRRLGRGRRQDIFALADLRLHPAEDEGDRGGQSRPEGRSGGHHRSGLLQRRPASGHQGRRQDRGPGSAAHHQRADRGGARLRPRQAEDRHHRGL